MSKSAPIPPPGFEDLSTDDKIAYVHSLWDLIAADVENEPVPAWQMKILEERIAELEANPESVLPWDEVLDRVSRQLGPQDSVR